MKLSELVAFKNQFDLLPSVESIKLTAEFEFLKIKYLVDSTELELQEYSQELTENKNNLQQSFNQIEYTIKKIKDYISNIIAQEEISYYETSYRFYQDSISVNMRYGYTNEDADIHFFDKHGVIRHVPLEVKNKHKNLVNNEILNSDLELSESLHNLIMSRITSYGDWHYPAAIIRPGNNNHINQLVANDPLYLIDQHKDLLAPSMTKFNLQYQNRLRPYIIDESTGTSILDKLPNNQFSFILAYNYFNNKPLDIIKIYLEEIFEKLRPGGTLGMTFNNCDYASAVIRVENRIACYTPGRMIIEHSAKIGYKEHIKIDSDESITWIELRKPGESYSLRGGQTLAKINHK